MKKIKNKRVRILGIVMSMIGIVLLGQPIVAMLFGNNLNFSFFGLFSGAPSVIVLVVILILGLFIISMTKPLD